MSIFVKDTIAALATAPLPAGVAVIRVSGAEAKPSVISLCESFRDVSANFMHFGRLKSVDGVVIDEVLMVFFGAPRSFTGEDVVEIHCHGGKAVIEAILSALRRQGVRMAEAGEFSKRAFMNGKMDLTAAEGIMDLVAAETEAQRKQALSQLQGALAVQFEGWRTDILHMLAHVEAGIDFPDEELDVIADAGIVDKLTILLNDLNDAVSTDVGQRLRDGFHLSILGKPNAGKSTLTNLLTGKETAIVSDIAGTTRDVVEAHLNIGGFPIILADTAGLRETDDVIEREGVNRAKARAYQSDLRIIMVDAHEWPALDEALLEHIVPERTLFVLSKFDKLNHSVECIRSIKENQMVNYKGVDYPALLSDLTSAEALTPILATLQTLIERWYGGRQNAALLTRERHKRAVADTVGYLNQALTIAQTGSPYSISELIAQDLRDAAGAIGTVTGRTDTEDVLDVVFSSFCIGK